MADSGPAPWHQLWSSCGLGFRVGCAPKLAGLGRFRGLGLAERAQFNEQSDLEGPLGYRADRGLSLGV